jgi:hypothetical protein
VKFPVVSKKCPLKKAILLISPAVSLSFTSVLVM